MASTYVIMYKNEIFVDEFVVSNTRGDTILSDAREFIKSLPLDIRKHVVIVHENSLDDDDESGHIEFDFKDFSICDRISNDWEEFLSNM